MKAITVHAPWSDYIAHEKKRYETRGWDTRYRGLIAIHSGKRWTEEEQEAALRLHQMFPDLPLIESPSLGSILCICRLIDCHRTEGLRGQVSRQERAVGGWSDGRYAWELEVLEVFPTPIKAIGQKNLWDWEIPQDLLEKRVAVVGSRDYKDLEAVRRYVYSLPQDTTIVSGGARGVDKAAEDAAKERNMRTVILNVNTRGLPQENEVRRREVFAQRAMWRNGEIVELSGSVAAFWDGKSAGTKNTIERAEKAGKTVLLNPSVAEEAPKQLALIGFVHSYDEGAYIEHLIARKGLSDGVKEEEEDDVSFEWEAPWLRKDNRVWVAVNGKREYQLFPRESEEASRQARLIRGFFYNSNTQDLLDWLAESAGIQKTPGFVADVADMGAGYSLRNDAEVETIPLSNAILTQDSYLPAIYRRYCTRFSATDEEGNLPYGVRFSDSDKVYVLDGTHRVLAARWWGHPAFTLEVNTFPETFAQACGLVPFEDADDTETIEFYADVLREAIAIISKIKSVENEVEYA